VAQEPGEAARQSLGAGGAPLRPRSPDHRPAWLVVLSTLALCYGGALLVTSLEALRAPRLAEHAPSARALTPAEEDLARQISDVATRVAAAHARAIRADAAQSLPAALLMLLAAAATMSRDRRGRQIALAAAWTGIANQLVTLALTFPVVRDYAWQSAALYASLVTMQGGAAVGNEATPELFGKVLVALPFVTTAGAIAGAALFIRYFGGRRGRVLYGLERRRES